MCSTRMNIVFSSDDRYAEHLATTIASILLNADKEDKFKFFILTNDFSNQTKEKIFSLKKLKDFEIEFIPVDIRDFAHCPELCHLKIQTYFRLKIPDYIKESKVLYLDCDILVRKSLRSLYNTDVKDCIAGVVEDKIVSLRADTDSILYKLDLEKYFNAGVMLWNLDKAREFDVGNKCFEFVQKFPEKLTYCDQCVLNVVLKDNVKYLDNIYNFQYNAYRNNIHNFYEANKHNIVLIHFVSDKKPWNFGIKRQFCIEYCKYLLYTPWRYRVCNYSLALKKIKFVYKYILKENWI